MKFLSCSTRRRNSDSNDAWSPNARRNRSSSSDDDAVLSNMSRRSPSPSVRPGVYQDARLADADSDGEGCRTDLKEVLSGNSAQNGTKVQDTSRLEVFMNA